MSFYKEYNLYYIKIYRFVYRLSFSHQDSEDITQDVFISLNNEINKNKLPENVKAWLYKCAVNRFINQNKRKKIFTLTDNINNYESSNLNTVESDFILNEKKRTIADALKNLTHKEQLLINLYNDEFSYKEISEILDIKFTSVGKTLSRVIEKLANQIKLENHERVFTERNII